MCSLISSLEIKRRTSETSRGWECFKEDEVRAILKGEEMLINTRKLRSLNACEREVNEVKMLFPKGVELKKLIRYFIQEHNKPGEHNHEYLGFANWLIVRCMTREHYIKYACYAASLVLYLYEEAFPGDDRPREAIRLATVCFKNKSEENRTAARAAGPLGTH